MIRGLYEAHLPVRDLKRSISFYEGLGLELYKRYEKVAFFWIEKEVSWLGLWEGEEVETTYHPSLRHVAFRVEYEELRRAKEWLEERGIRPREAFGFRPWEPIVIPDQAHGMLYFDDPDGNSLELITRLPGPEMEKPKMYLSEWERIRRRESI